MADEFAKSNFERGADSRTSRYVSVSAWTDWTDFRRRSQTAFCGQEPFSMRGQLGKNLI
jgi:hypothetical protein